MSESIDISSTNGEQKKGFRVVLQNKDFMKLWIGQLISNIGSSIGSLALLFYAFVLTGSELAMAGLAMMQVIPLVLFSGIIGVYVDRWDRKKVLIASDIVRAAVTILYPFVSFFPSFFQPLTWLYVLAFFYATANAFFFPARNASVPRLVASEDLVTANSLSQMTFQIVTLVFTPLGGALMAFIAPDYFLGFLIDSAAFVGSALVLITLRTSLVPEVSLTADRSYMNEIRDAVGLVRRNSIISFLLIISSCLMVVGGMLNALVVPFFQGELAFDEFYFSLILSGTSVSGIIVALILGQKSTIKRPLFLITLAMITAGVVEALLAFIATGDFLSALLLMSAIGGVNIAISVPNNAIMQEIIADKMRGKIFSFQSVMTNSAQLIGMAIAGVWAESIGSSRPPVFFGAVGMVIVGVLGTVAVIITKLHGHLWKIREERISVSQREEIDIPNEPIENSEDSTF